MEITCEYTNGQKWKWVWHMAWTKDNKWAIRSPEWRITKGLRSVRRLKCHWRADIEGRQGATWTRTTKDRESWRMAEGATIVEGHSLK